MEVALLLRDPAMHALTVILEGLEKICYNPNS